MNKLTKILTATLMMLPVIASAQLGGLGNLIGEVDLLMSILIRVVMAIALLTFFWGLVKFIFPQGSETAKVEAKKIMLWGLIALFVMVSVWGLVRFMQDALSLTDFDAPTFRPLP